MQADVVWVDEDVYNSDLSLFVFVPTVCLIVFCNKRMLAGAYVLALAPLFLVAFIVVPVGTVLIIAGYQSLRFAWKHGDWLCSCLSMRLVCR